MLPAVKKANPEDYRSDEDWKEAYDFTYKDSLESPVQKRPTDFKNYNTLIGSGSTFVENTLRKGLSWRYQKEKQLHQEKE